MTRIPSDVSDMHKARLKDLQQKRNPSSFKRIIEEKRHRDNSKEKDQGCVISIFELPRSHFDLSDDENGVAAAPPTAAPLAATCAHKLPATPTVQLPTEIEPLFEKMASEMLLLSASGENETTIFLKAPEFGSSPFYGTRITIKEFSTAPKAFNIEIAASSAVLTLLNSHKSALLDAFAKGDFNFSIGRLETEIQDTERPLFHRKEAVSQDQGSLS